MFNIYEKILYITVIVFLVGCSGIDEIKQVKVTAFPIVKELKSTIMETSPVIMAPNRLFVLNDQLWLMQNKEDSIFSVFSLPDCKYLYSIGNVGRGPNEFLSPDGGTVQTKGRDTFTILDNSVVKTVKFSQDGKLSVVAREQPFETFPINGFVKLDEVLYCSFADCASGTTGDKEYRLVDARTKKETKFGDYPNLIAHEFDNEQRCQMYYKNLTANDEKRKFAAFYSFFKYFRVFDYDCELMNEVFVEIAPFESSVEQKTVFYGRPFSTANYIYVPCSSTELQVWDWDGNPIASFTIDRKFFCYAIDESKRKMYIVSPREESINKVYVYDISF